MSNLVKEAVKPKAKRQYEPLWEALKEHRKVELILQPEQLTERQLLNQTKTLRKAISKEKYMDEVFRLQYPHAEVTSVRSHRTVTFRLSLNDADPFTDF